MLPAAEEAGQQVGILESKVCVCGGVQRHREKLVTQCGSSSLKSAERENSVTSDLKRNELCLFPKARLQNTRLSK